jgi:hypothetical protein
MNMQAYRRQLIALAAFGICAAFAQSRGLAEEGYQPENYRPQWIVGQRWIVASKVLQSQARRDPKSAGAEQATRWQFEVRAIEKIDDRECFKVEIKCLEGEAQPLTTLWVDRQAMTLRRVQTQLPVIGGFRTVTENYRAASGQPFPAFAPLSVPPLELPLFLAGTKGTQTFDYEASSTPEGEKGVGDLDFAFSVEQQITQPQAEKIKGLLPPDYTKDLVQKPTIEVQLKAASVKARQLWQSGLPWPVYSNNGIAESRLVESFAPQAPANPPASPTPQ